MQLSLSTSAVAGFRRVGSSSWCTLFVHSIPVLSTSMEEPSADGVKLAGGHGPITSALHTQVPGSPPHIAKVQIHSSGSSEHRIATNMVAEVLDTSRYITQVNHCSEGAITTNLSAGVPDPFPHNAMSATAPDPSLLNAEVKLCSESSEDISLPAESVHSTAVYGSSGHATSSPPGVSDPLVEVNPRPGSSNGGITKTATTLEKAVDEIPVNTVGTTCDPAAVVEQVETKPPPDPPALVVVKPTPYRGSLSQQGSAEKHLTGMKPIVPLRRRGQSFRETTKMVRTVDADGRRHLNQYTLMEQLGKGAYGVVFKVQCNETKQHFAAKVVDKKALKRIRVGRFGNVLQSVKKELNIWKRFKHRHIVVLREVIDTEESDELYMISELVDGGPVLDNDIKCTPLNAELTRTYFTHLIEGIDFLHENKIIHRDIKPGNLLLKTVGENEQILKIADFGVSHEIENDNENMRQTAGTAIFMAPEMLTGESFQGKPIDIWACGITLYMFVYGYPPFVAQTMAVLYAKIQNDPIQYPEVVGDRVVESELIDLMQHILDKNPKQRFTSQQIRAHPWAWREFQVSAVKCVTQPEGRPTSFTSIPKSFYSVASIGKSMRTLLSRPSAVFPGGSNRSSLPTVMANFRAPQ